MRKLLDSLERYALLGARGSGLGARDTGATGAGAQGAGDTGAGRRGAGRGHRARGTRARGARAQGAEHRGRGAQGRGRTVRRFAPRPEICHFYMKNAYLGVSKERLTDAPSSFIVHNLVRLPGKGQARGQARGQGCRQRGPPPNLRCAMSRNDARRIAKVRKRASLALEKWTMRHASMTDRGSRRHPLIAEAVT
jgi:hypothetical protein